MQTNSELFECVNSIEQYQCGQCPTFQTHFITDLRLHFTNLIRGPKRVQYKCKMCAFATFSSLVSLGHRSLANHSLKNVRRALKPKTELSPKKDQVVPSSEPKSQTDPAHKCQYCTYSGKQKEHLRRHVIMRHSLEDQIEWFPCQYCPSRFKLKHHLTRHMHCHADPAVINWFKCDKCESKFKLEEYLRRHLKSCCFKLEEVYLFKCQQCSNKYKDNRDLRKHLRFFHGNPEDIQWFQCDTCAFKTKYASSLRKHARTQHAGPDEVQWFECGGCNFRTKHRHSFKNHLQTRHAHD